MFDHIHPLVLPIGFFFGICSIIGVTGNIIMLIVSYNNKRLRSPCHILISITCFVDLLHECGQFPFVYNVFSGTKVPQYKCFYIQAVPLIGVLYGAPLILAMGVDRLMAIIAPAKYRMYQDMKLKYVCMQMVFPTIYTIALMVIAGTNNIPDEFECAIPVGLFGAFSLFTYTGFILYISIILIYVVAAYALHKKGGSSRFKSVFVSIAVTVGLVVFGWIITTITNTCSYMVTGDEFYRQIMQQYAGITVNIATASNAFVYFALNQEYRNAMKRLFGFKTPGSTGAEPSVSVTPSHHGKRGSRHSVATVTF